MSKTWFRPVFVCPHCGVSSFEAETIRTGVCAVCRKHDPDYERRDPPQPIIAPKEKTTVNHRG